MVRGQEAKSLTIGRLAAEAGVGVETVRFYQRKGLIATPERAGGIRRYERQDLRRLRFVRKAQSAGFTLDEIKELLALDSGEDRVRARALAASRLEALDSKIAELSRARDSLRHLALECGEGGTGPCPILASFGV